MPKTFEIVEYNTCFMYFMQVFFTCDADRSSPASIGHFFDNAFKWWNQFVNRVFFSGETENIATANFLDHDFESAFWRWHYSLRSLDTKRSVELVSELPLEKQMELAKAVALYPAKIVQQFLDKLSDAVNDNEKLQPVYQNWAYTKQLLNIQ